ncbi:probable RNA methyltransferase At5g51130 [Trifolium pratense]|nr:probable RNA methyltransferase At5g51130 [Trifolium pratense]
MSEDNNGRKREQVETLKQKQNNKKPKQVFPYGNYKSYYNYRIGDGVDCDPRLKVFRKEWFEGKDCLDIGCNSGIITIQIALKFNCRSILGVDIDSDRVEDGNWNLRKTARLKSAANKPSKVSKLKDNSHTDHSENNATVPSNVDTKEISIEPSSLEQVDLLKTVSFKRENFVLTPHPLGKQYDTILCLSVSKWIHLNWGDDGLITLFAETWKLLRPGGIFVLEPQPWKSYVSNRAVSETTAANFRNIKFRPQDFQEILLDKIGFRTVEAITSDLTGSTTGFNRPILIFQK